MEAPVADAPAQQQRAGAAAAGGAGAGAAPQHYPQRLQLWCSTTAVAASSLPPEPRSYHEATSGPEGGQWDAAAQLEWDQLEQ
jgi:hypothetical protein